MNINNHHVITVSMKGSRHRTEQILQVEQMQTASELKRYFVRTHLPHDNEHTEEMVRNTNFHMMA